MESKQVKSKERVAEHGEVFTAAREVNAMLDLVKNETERIESRFLEPACGNGNFLAEVLRRKLAVVKKRYGGKGREADYEQWSVIAVMNIYGVELLEGNIEECRGRLYDIWNTAYVENCGKEAGTDRQNAVWEFKRYEDASLEYTGLDGKHDSEKDVDLFNTVITKEEYLKLAEAQRQAAGLAAGS